jgi:hypothetical protein
MFINVKLILNPLDKATPNYENGPQSKLENSKYVFFFPGDGKSFEMELDLANASPHGGLQTY